MMLESNWRKKMKTSVKTVAAKYRLACIKSYTLIQKHGNLCLLLLGGVLITVGAAELSAAQLSGTPVGGTSQLESFSKAGYDDGLVKASVGNLFCLIEGAFGALIMVVAGLGAIVAAAMGAYRAAVGMLVVAVGAFILRSLVSLFFGTGYDGYAADGNAVGCK